MDAPKNMFGKTLYRGKPKRGQMKGSPARTISLPFSFFFFLGLLQSLFTQIQRIENRV
jgi:hypothetical protein